MSSDLELIEGIRRRDANALSELYDRYGQRVYALCASILQEETASEEVTQDVFLKIWRYPERYRYDDNRFVAWLLTMTRHAALDRLRHDRRRGAGAHSIDEDTFPELPDVRSGEEARWREMTHAMSHLPPEQRDAIALAYYHGLSQSEISEHLGVPLGTVKTRIRLGMEKLRSVFRLSDD
jgi:RNA polymerase sigma-70 factor, ECF subfamily